MLSIYKVHFDEVIEVPKSSIKNFGLLIRKKRQVVGLTQRELSKKAFGRSCRKYINMLEKGMLQNITFSTADKICMALNIELQFQVNEPVKEPQQLSFF